MRIAMVGPFGLHPNKTMRSRAFGLARALSDRGHQTKIIMPPWQEPQKANQTWQEDGVDLHYTPVSGGTLGITRQLISETNKWQPDVVHCFKPKAYSGLVAWWMWHFQRDKIRIIMDSDDWEGWGGWNDRAAYSPIQKRFFSWQEHWGMAHCHGLTVASKALQSIALSQGIIAEKILYLPNGAGIIAPEKPFSTEDISAKKNSLGLNNQPVLLLYSRVFEFDPSRMAAVLAGVKSAVPELVILFVGESLYAEEAVRFRQYLSEKNILDAFVDLGWVEPGELPLLFQCSDAGIYLMDDTLINRTKCPVKLADLVASGIPVAAEAVGQVPEYVLSGKTGYLRQSGDTKGLIQDMVHLLENRGLRSEMSEKAKVHYRENFSWELAAQKLEQVYEH